METTNTNKKVIIIGALSTYFFYRDSRQPSKKHSKFYWIRSAQCGGSGYYQAVYLASHSIETHLLGCVGLDYWGYELLSALDSYGVSRNHVKKIEYIATGVTNVVETSRGQWYADHWLGANHEIDAEDIAELINDVADFDLVVSQLEISLSVITSIFRKAVCRGALTLLNVAPFCLIPKSLLQYCHYLVVDEIDLPLLVSGYADGLCNENVVMQKLMQEGVSCVIVIGQNGSITIYRIDGCLTIIGSVDIISKNAASRDKFVGKLIEKIMNCSDWIQELANEMHKSV